MNLQEHMRDRVLYHVGNRFQSVPENVSDSILENVWDRIHDHPWDPHAVQRERPETQFWARIGREMMK